jgi:hypothetical protein
MTTIRAAEILHDAGFLPIPIGTNRQPLVAWHSLQGGFTKEAMQQMPWNGGLGIIIDGFEVLDFDLKNTPDKTIWQQWKDAVCFVKPDALDGLLVIGTPHEGFHVIYRTKANEPSRKLANGPNGETIIETRGKGGLVYTLPTDGYVKIQGSWTELIEITEDHRQLLIQMARGFDLTPQAAPPQVTQSIGGESVFTRFNSENEVLHLALGNGWTSLGERGGKHFLNRPGGGGTDPSANVKGNTMWVFSTSQTDLPTDKALTPFDLFLAYEHNGDMKAAVRNLHEIYKTECKIDLHATATTTVLPSLANDRPYIWNIADEVKELTPFLSFMIDGNTRHYIPEFGMLTITGQAGSYKTAIMRAIAASMISGKVKASCKAQSEKNVLLFDTELSKAQFQKNMTNIHAQAGGKNTNRIRAYWLTPMSAGERRSWIDRIIKEEGKDAGLIIIDGWRDLLTDFNDNKEVEGLIAQITQWRELTGAVMCGVIHVNPGSQKMRGTIGTELMNKSDGVILVERNQDTGQLQMRFQRGRAWATPPHIDLFVDDNHQAFHADDPDRQYQQPIVNKFQTGGDFADFVPF